MSKTVSIRTEKGNTGFNVEFDENTTLSQLFARTRESISGTDYDKLDVTVESNGNNQFTINSDYVLTHVDDFHEETVKNLTGNESLSSVTVFQDNLYKTITHIFLSELF